VSRIAAALFASDGFNMLCSPFSLGFGMVIPQKLMLN
jgi:hypothetical protein